MLGAPPKRRIGDKILGGYVIVNILGSGAFARVYRALDVQENEVAVKVLTDLDEASRLRFAREIKVLRSLPPNKYVAAYIDHGMTEDKHPVLVLEYVDGITLREGIARRPKLSPEQAVNFVARLCRAFSGLHELGVAHRDVKPGNILISRSGEIKLIDFGLIWDAQGILRLLETEGDARFERRIFSEDIDTGILAGTLEYMAPEQLADSTVESMHEAQTDTPTDVFSLGVILMELLTGERPFAKRPSKKLINRQDVLTFIQWRLKETESIIPKLEGITPPLRSIIRKALCHDPSLRQMDSRELGADLRRFAATGQGVAIDDSKTQSISMQHHGALIPTRIIQPAQAEEHDSSPTARLPQLEMDSLEAFSADVETIVSPTPLPQDIPFLALDEFDSFEEDAPTEISHNTSLHRKHTDAQRAVANLETHLKTIDPHGPKITPATRSNRNSEDDTIRLPPSQSSKPSSETSEIADLDQERDSYPSPPEALSFAESLDEDATTNWRPKPRRKR